MPQIPGEGPHPTFASNRLSTRDMRLIIASTRFVEPLRTVETFVNGASRFGMYLLEVQQYKRAPCPLSRGTDVQLSSPSLYLWRPWQDSNLQPAA